MKGWGHIV